MITMRMLEHNPIPAMRGLTVAQAEVELERQQGEVDFDVRPLRDPGAVVKVDDMDWFIRNADLLRILRRSGEY